ncbi:hypothetical protein B0H10DRAFT_1942863 [Mycena sp. CBHHK59/15]|nr:hypothetical protein B0H10DRAFT_1942863 [Mycena sp. CBHHK59/15]
MVGTALKTIQDAVAAPFDPNAPLWLRDGYGAGIRQARIYSGSVELTNLKKKFPNVKFWTRKIYLEHPSSKRNDSASAEKTSTSAGATKQENDINVEGRYVEYDDGTVVGGIEFSHIREEVRYLLADLRMAGMVPRSIKQLGHQALCVVSEMYRGWAKNKSGLVGYDSDSDSGSDGAGKTGSKRKKALQTSKSRKQRRVTNPAEDPALTRMSPLPQPLPPAEPQPLPPVEPQPLPPPLPQPLPPAEPPANSESDHPTHPPSPSSEGPSGPAPPNNEVENILCVACTLRMLLSRPTPASGIARAATATTAQADNEDKEMPGPAKAHTTHTTSRNLCLAVYAVDVGGTVAEFALHWKALTDEKPLSALFKAYDTYLKEIKGKQRPAVDKIQKRIQEILRATSDDSPHPWHTIRHRNLRLLPQRPSRRPFPQSLTKNPAVSPQPTLQPTTAIYPISESRNDPILVLVMPRAAPLPSLPYDPLPLQDPVPARSLPAETAYGPVQSGLALVCAREHLWAQLACGEISAIAWGSYSTAGSDFLADLPPDQLVFLAVLAQIVALEPASWMARGRATYLALRLSHHWVFSASSHPAASPAGSSPTQRLTEVSTGGGRRGQKG